MKPGLPIGFARPPAQTTETACLALFLAARTQSESRGGDGAKRPGGESGEGSAIQHWKADTCDRAHNATRLILRYDPVTQTFSETVQDVTSVTPRQVRMEVQLSSGVEPGPTSPREIAPGHRTNVSPPAIGENFATWGAHPVVATTGSEVLDGNAEGAGENGAAYDRAFAPDRVEWATVGFAGLEHTGYGLGVGFWLAEDAWTPNISPSASEHQPTISATWTSEGAGYDGADAPMQIGEARVDFTLGSGTQAVRSVEGVPTIGLLPPEPLTIVDGRFEGGLEVPPAELHLVIGQFGGPNQYGIFSGSVGSECTSSCIGEQP